MKHIAAFLLSIFAFLFIPTACSDYESSVPVTRVYLTLNLSYSDKDLIPLFAYKIFTAPRYAGEYVGYAGVLVVHGNEDTYYAYDLCCPYESDASITVTPSDDGTATCESCGSIFNIIDGGYRVSGPELSGSESSKAYLRKYNVITSGSTLVIEN